MVAITAAILGVLSGLLSGIIDIIMQLPTAIKLVVFYALFTGLGIEIPGTTISIGRDFLSPLFIGVFGFLGIYADYNLLWGLFTIILLLYYCHFFMTGWMRK